MTKNFDEFLSFVDGELILIATDAVNKQKIKFQFPLTPENITNFINALVAANSLITVQILRQYHHWLHS